jgi:hypothetical protein
LLAVVVAVVAVVVAVVVVVVVVVAVWAEWEEEDEDEEEEENVGGDTLLGCFRGSEVFRGRDMFNLLEGAQRRVFKSGEF